MSLSEWVLRSILILVAVSLIGATLYFDTRTLLVYSVTGKQGPRGVQGVSGMVGAKGLPGFPGFQGFFGPTGPLGVTGVDGPMGPAGPTGVSGPQGPTGPTGFPNPQARGPTGPQGPFGVAQTGATGASSLFTGATGSRGPTGSRTSSSLGITYSGITGQLGPATTVVFTPESHSIAGGLPIFPVYSSFVVGPAVSITPGLNTPLLEIRGLTYKIAATLVAQFSTNQTGSPTAAALTCQINLTARNTVTATPVIFASELITVAANQDGVIPKTYSMNMRLG